MIDVFESDGELRGAQARVFYHRGTAPEHLSEFVPSDEDTDRHEQLEAWLRARIDAVDSVADATVYVDLRLPSTLITHPFDTAEGLISRLGEDHYLTVGPLDRSHQTGALKRHAQKRLDAAWGLARGVPMTPIGTELSEHVVVLDPNDGPASTPKGYRDLVLSLARRKPPPVCVVVSATVEPSGIGHHLVRAAVDAGVPIVLGPRAEDPSAGARIREDTVDTACPCTLRAVVRDLRSDERAPDVILIWDESLERPADWFPITER